MFQLAKSKIIVFHISPSKMAIYPVTWSLYFKFNITNRLPDPENLSRDEYNKIFRLVKVNYSMVLFSNHKMAAIPSHMAVGHHI